MAKKWKSRPKNSDRDFLSIMQNQITRLNTKGKYGTAQNYTKTLNSFSLFLNHKSIPITAINQNIIDSYYTFLLRRGLVRNSISFYMRVLRAVYHSAVKDGTVIDCKPFTEVYTGIDKTIKRAVPTDTIKRLKNMDLDKLPKLKFARDIFLFSFYTRGMTFVDIAYLQQKNISGDTLWYRRRKTGQLLCIRLEPCIRQIIEQYSSPNSNYLFPIISSKEPMTANTEYRKALNSHNRLILKLGKMIHPDCKLTSYTPRHSWATAARNRNVPISIISAGMGHNSEKTTQIYLESLANDVIDDANLGIISELS